MLMTVEITVEKENTGHALAALGAVAQKLNDRGPTHVDYLHISSHGGTSNLYTVKATLIARESSK